LRERPMTKRIRWSLALPLMASLLTVALVMSGRHQYEQETSKKIIWDYFTLSEIMLDSINYPAAVATELFGGGPHSFRIGMDSSARPIILYFAFVVLQWFVAGSLIEEGTRHLKRRAVSLSFAGVALISGIMFGLIAVHTWNAYPLLIGMSGIFWGILLIFVAVRLTLVGRLSA